MLIFYGNSAFAEENVTEELNELPTIEVDHSMNSDSMHEYNSEKYTYSVNPSNMEEGIIGVPLKFDIKSVRGLFKK